MENYHTFSVKEVIKKLKTNQEKGLSDKEVKIRQEKFGKNNLPKEKPLSNLYIFLEQLRSPLIYILIIAGLVTLILREYTDSIIIFIAVLLNTIVGYVQENKASNSLRELKKVLSLKSVVLRNGYRKEISADDLAPGDIILLKSGDKVPADGRLIDSYNLKINESALTGEWMPAKKTTKVLSKDTSMADRDNMVYMGTIVESGQGKAVISSIGLQTEIGKVAAIVKETKEEKTPYQKKLSRFSKIVGIVIGIICVLIFIEGMMTLTHLGLQDRFEEMFTTAVAVAVAAIPEGLPVVMTVVLALGMERILRKKGLVRKLVSAETLGSTSVICSDKTGTLTQGKMRVNEILSAEEILQNKKDIRNNLFLLKIGILCSEAFIENPEEPLKKWVVRGMPTEKAIVLAGIQASLTKKELEKKESEISVISFNTEYKYSASLYKLLVNNADADNSREYIFYIKGAPEVILKKSKYFKLGKEEKEIHDQDLKNLNQKCKELTSKGYRVLALAYKKIDSLQARNCRDIAELSNDIVFAGFIALKDPIRKEVKKTIQICRKAGIKPIIVTGDHKLTAKAVAMEIGFHIEDKNIIEGKDLEKMPEREFEKRIRDIQVYARVEPKQKLKIVNAWQKKGEVVAMTGDGVNDSPALKSADIGIALGSGTEVAKETSDLVLLTDNFSIIVAAIEEGRSILDNIRKVITYLLSDSFSEIILVGVSIAAGLPLPITALQILWINLVEDGLPNIALAFEPKEKDLMKQKPQSRDIPLLTREMKAIIFIIGLITDLILLALFIFLWKQTNDIHYTRTMIFACLTIDSLFYVFSCKSLRRNIWHTNPFSNKFLIGACAFGVLMLLVAIYMPFFQNLFSTVSLGFNDWLIIVILGLTELILIEMTKWYFIVRRQTGVQKVTSEIKQK